MGIEAIDIRAGYGAKIVVDGFSIEIPKGRVTSVIGPNGSGKSTLLKTLGRILSPSAGSVLLDGKDIHRMNTTEVARKLSLLPQTHVAPSELPVRDFVAYGRFPHIRTFASFAKKDHEIVDAAIRLTGLDGLQDRSLAELSGGERQRAWIALNLAQEPEIMLLDEPTTFLDLRHQNETLKLIRELNEKLGVTIVMVLHDLNHAARCSHGIIALKDGRVYRRGTPKEVVSVDLIRDLFGIESRIIENGGHPFFIPIEN
jgi:iron complex transport system ATP-binding protein